MPGKNKKRKGYPVRLLSNKGKTIGRTTIDVPASYWAARGEYGVINAKAITFAVTRSGRAEAVAVPVVNSLGLQYQVVHWLHGDVEAGTKLTVPAGTLWVG